MLSLPSPIVWLLVAGALSAAPTPPTRVTIAATDRAALAEWDGRLQKMQEDGALIRTTLEADTMLPNRTIERLQQRVQNLPVRGGELVVQRQGGALVSVFGLLFEQVTIDPEPRLSANEALVKARAATASAARLLRPPELVIFPIEARASHLVYELRLQTDGDRPVVFVDAHDGRIVDRYSNVQTR